MYSIDGFCHMIADRGRMDPYARALREAITEGCVVLDIGTGTGIFALLACRFGAGRVYAIEPDHSIQVARETAALNGWADRVVFIQDLSTRVDLPERAQVIISDLRGVLPCFQHHLPAIIDARQRFLAPGGAMIPRRDSLWMAPVEKPELYARHTSPWGDNGYDFDHRPARRLLTNTWRKTRVSPEHLIAEPRRWASLDYSTIEGRDIHGEVSWEIGKAGTAHGLCVWFDADLADGIGFSNAPGQPEHVYGQAFFPWTEPVDLDVGDVVTASLHADLVVDDYVWRWDTRILGRGSPGRIKADYRQSTFFGVPLSPARLRLKSEDHVPTLDEDGQIDRQILSLMDGQTPSGEIARRLRDRFPARFDSWQAALTRVGDLSQRYSR